MKGKFPTRWIPFDEEKPGIRESVLVYSRREGVQFGYVSLARYGTSWKTEYICVRKSRNHNSPIIKDITHWCYAPTAD